MDVDCFETLMIINRRLKFTTDNPFYISFLRGFKILQLICIAQHNTSHHIYTFCRVWILLNFTIKLIIEQLFIINIIMIYYRFFSLTWMCCSIKYYSRCYSSQLLFDSLQKYSGFCGNLRLCFMSTTLFIRSPTTIYVKC